MLLVHSLQVMDRSSPLDVTIIDKDESSEQSYNVVDGFIIEDSKSPFPVSSDPLPDACSPMVTKVTMISLNGERVDTLWALPGPSHYPPWHIVVVVNVLFEVYFVCHAVGNSCYGSLPFQNSSFQKFFILKQLLMGAYVYVGSG